jgi:hypothetical protein
LLNAEYHIKHSVRKSNGETVLADFAQTEVGCNGEVGVISKS